MVELVRKPFFNFVEFEFLEMCHYEFEGLAQFLCNGDVFWVFLFVDPLFGFLLDCVSNPIERQNFISYHMHGIDFKRVIMWRLKQHLWGQIALC